MASVTDECFGERSKRRVITRGPTVEYNRFEELPVWQAGMTLAERILVITQDKAFAFQGDLANQLQRAGLSVCNNIAEGFERGSTSEFLGETIRQGRRPQAPAEPTEA